MQCNNKHCNINIELLAHIVGSGLMETLNPAQSVVQFWLDSGRGRVWSLVRVEGRYHSFWDWNSVRLMLV